MGLDRCDPLDLLGRGRVVLRAVPRRPDRAGRRPGWARTTSGGRRTDTWRPELPRQPLLHETGAPRRATWLFSGQLRRLGVARSSDAATARHFRRVARARLTTAATTSWRSRGRRAIEHALGGDATRARFVRRTPTRPRPRPVQTPFGAGVTLTTRPTGLDADRRRRVDDADHADAVHKRHRDRRRRTRTTRSSPSPATTPTRWRRERRPAKCSMCTSTRRPATATWTDI